MSHNELDANFEHFWFGVLPALVKMVDPCDGQHSRHDSLLPSSSLNDLL